MFRMFRQAALAIVSGILLALGSALYAREFNWPDFYHIEYGFPLAWLIRTLSTIAGPTDTYSFQMLEFAFDWVFWSVIATVVLLIARKASRMKPP